VISRYPLSLSGNPGLGLPPPLAREWEWQTLGQCVGYPADVFFPEDVPRGVRHRLERQAKSICVGCPVIDQCLLHALNTPEPHGVWGAMTPGERQQYRSAQAGVARTPATRQVSA
jgi:WhiB family transcriptional regulator, redox-sensing transcriptional regulator